MMIPSSSDLGLNISPIFTCSKPSLIVGYEMNEDLLNAGSMMLISEEGNYKFMRLLDNMDMLHLIYVTGNL